MSVKLGLTITILSFLDKESEAEREDT
jgi:hypothetical protein